MIPDPDFDWYPSRIQGSKRHRIPDPDQQHSISQQSMIAAVKKTIGPTCSISLEKFCRQMGLLRKYFGQICPKLFCQTFVENEKSLPVVFPPCSPLRSDTNPSRLAS